MRGNPRFPTAAGADRSHRVEAIEKELRSPLQHRRPADTERRRDGTVRRAVARHQDLARVTTRYGAVALCDHFVRTFRSLSLNTKGVTG